MHYLKRVQALALIVSLSWFAGCNSGVDSSDGFSTGQQSASVFTVATDAPLPSVISFQLTVDSITLFNGTTNVSVLSQPAMVDFARLNGLHELVDLNTVAVGTYTSATLTLASPVIWILGYPRRPAGDRHHQRHPIANDCDGAVCESFCSRCR